MYESESFVYLDVQKTGTTYIFKFLKIFCSEKRLYRRKHRAVGERYDARKLHFISVRDPLDQYLSLYSYGCDGNGGVRKRLERRGYGHLYTASEASFQEWLKLVLDAENAAIVDAAYSKAGNGQLPHLIGFQSFRFLKLVFRDPEAVFNSCSTIDDVREAYRSRSIVSVIIRHSHFASDLKQLVQTRLRNAVRDVDEAIRYLDQAPAKNASKRVDKQAPLIVDPTVIDMLRAREWLFYSGIVQT